MSRWRSARRASKRTACWAAMPTCAPGLFRTICPPPARTRRQARCDADGARGALDIGITGHGLAWGEHRAVVLSVDARIDREGRKHSWLRLRSNGITLGGFAITDTRLALDGLTGDHSLHFRVGTGQDAVSLRGRGAWADGRYTLQLQDIDASGPRSCPGSSSPPDAWRQARRRARSIRSASPTKSADSAWGPLDGGQRLVSQGHDGIFPLEALDPKRLGAPATADCWSSTPRRPAARVSPGPPTSAPRSATRRSPTSPRAARNAASAGRRASRSLPPRTSPP